MPHILVINGPNINLLGNREVNTYGSVSLKDVHSRLQQVADNLQIEISFIQSNAEHELLRCIHETIQNKVDFALLNPAAFTHTSIAMRDAILGVELRFIEVHISNIHAREEFRHRSYFSDIAMGVISGLGIIGYELALQAAVNILNTEQAS